MSWFNEKALRLENYAARRARPDALQQALFPYQEDWGEFSAGSFVHLPAGAPHAFQVDSETARFLDLTTPQHERFMRAAGEPAQGRILPPGGLPDMDRVGAAAQRYGVEIIGPPPGAPG